MAMENVEEIVTWGPLDRRGKPIEKHKGRTPVDESLRTVSTKPRFGLVKADAIPRPLTDEEIVGARRVAKFLRAHGVKFEGEFAMVGDFVIVDLGMRMLTPRELFLAQGFPPSYEIDRAWLVNPKSGAVVEVKLSKEAKIRMCGNSVCPPVARAITECNVPELSVWNLRAKRRYLARRDRPAAFFNTETQRAQSRNVRFAGAEVGA